MDARFLAVSTLCLVVAPLLSSVLSKRHTLPISPERNTHPHGRMIVRAVLLRDIALQKESLCVHNQSWSQP